MLAEELEVCAGLKCLDCGVNIGFLIIYGTPGTCYGLQDNKTIARLISHFLPAALGQEDLGTDLLRDGDDREISTDLHLFRNIVLDSTINAIYIDSLFVVAGVLLMIAPCVINRRSLKGSYVNRFELVREVDKLSVIICVVLIILTVVLKPTPQLRHIGHDHAVSSSVALSEIKHRDVLAVLPDIAHIAATGFKIAVDLISCIGDTALVSPDPVGDCLSGLSIRT